MTKKGNLCSPDAFAQTITVIQFFCNFKPGVVFSETGFLLIFLRQSFPIEASLITIVHLFPNQAHIQNFP